MKKLPLKVVRSRDHQRWVIMRQFDNTVVAVFNTKAEADSALPAADTAYMLGVFAAEKAMIAAIEKL